MSLYVVMYKCSQPSLSISAIYLLQIISRQLQVQDDAWRLRAASWHDIGEIPELPVMIDITGPTQETTECNMVLLIHSPTDVDIQAHDIVPVQDVSLLAQGI